MIPLIINKTISNPPPLQKKTTTVLKLFQMQLENYKKKFCSTIAFRGIFQVILLAEYFYFLTEQGELSTSSKFI